MTLRRRDLVVGAPAAGLLSVLAAGVAKGMVSQVVADDLYRLDDPATIMAAARAIMKEDWVGVLITIDESGTPRARPSESVTRPTTGACGFRRGAEAARRSRSRQIRRRHSTSASTTSPTVTRVVSTRVSPAWRRSIRIPRRSPRTVRRMSIGHSGRTTPTISR